ncbi:hypothetical protein [Ekhidna sp.]|uniref:hypothetical protein n=1 Tax=Ekhidna sp. TaxID=2608089 RepID=UPI003CCBFCB8
MKYLTIIFILLAGGIHAQVKFKTLQSFDDQPLNFKMDRFSTREYLPLQINLPDQSLITQEIDISDFSILTPHQYNLNGYPMADLSRMNDMLLGTSFSNTLQMGRQKIQTTYIFDINGNLIDSQTSFSIGKKNK